MLNSQGSLNRLGATGRNPYGPSAASLNLDFTASNTLDSRITFSRGSQATLFNSAGTLVYAKHNLVLQSEDFATTWTVTGATVSTNAATAPNGTATADKLAEDSNTGSHLVSQNITYGVGTYTASLFAKKAERDWVRVLFFDGTNTFSAFFNLNTGVVGTVSGAGASAAIQSVGDGWYRCLVTATTAAGAGSFAPRVALADNNSSYTGSTGSGIFIWGAQLNLAGMEGGVTSSLATYYPTTTAAYYAPRFDYNPSTLAAQGLLIEEQRTNSWTYSEDFGNAAWTKGGATVSTNTTTAPTGASVADSLIEDSSTGQHRVYRAISGTTNTNPYTVSFFAKADTRTRIYVGIAESPTFSRQGNAVFDLSSGTVAFVNTGANGATGGAATITNVGNGWYRCAYTLTLGGTDTSIFSDINLVSTGTTITYTGNGTSGLFIWGAQLEAGAFATSYIPTTTTALTRNADVASMTGTNFSSWYNASEGTFVGEAQKNYSGSTAFPRIVQISDATNNNAMGVLWADSLSRLYAAVTASGVTQADIGNNGLTQTAVHKSALAYKVNDFAISNDGLSVQTDTSGTVPTVDRMFIGKDSGATYFNGTIRRIAYYPVRLASSQLQALTA
jgi:hypothetical protein